MATRTIEVLKTDLTVDRSKWSKELREATKDSDRFGKSVTKNAKNTKNFSNTLSGAARGVAAIDGPLGGVSSRISNLNGLVNSGVGAWAALGGAVAGATFFVAASLREYTNLERQLLKTEALLKATGFAAGRTGADLDAQARAIARDTLDSAEDVRQAQAVLLTFRSISQENFDRTIVLAQDLGVVLGDTKTAALQLGKALEDPATGLTALKRSGVSFSETEKEVIKDLQETGRLAEAQALILDKLAQQVGGAGAGEAGGLAGKVDSLSQSWGELLERWAQTSGAATAAGVGVDYLTRTVDVWARDIAPTAEQRFNDLHKELVALQALEEKQKSLQGGFFFLPSALEQTQVRIAVIRKELSEIQDIQVQAEKDSAEALRKSEEEQLKIRQDFGAGVIKEIDTQLATEAEKLQQAHNKELQKLNNLVLSEADIRKRGYDTLEGLRKGYAERLNVQYEKELKDIQDRANKAANKEAEALKKQFETTDSQLRRQIALFGKTGQAAALSYDLARGKLSKLGVEQKAVLNELVGQLSDLEKKAKLDELNKQFKDLEDSLVRQVALYGQTGQAAKLRYDLEHSELAKLNKEQKDRLLSLQEDLDELSRADKFKQDFEKINDVLASELDQIRKKYDDLTATVRQGMKDGFLGEQEGFGILQDLNQKKDQELGAKGFDLIFGEGALDRVFSDFENIEENFKSLLAQLALEVAASSIAQFFGLPTGNLRTFDTLSAGIGAIFGRAGGGPVSPGRVYEIGEQNKPELARFGDRLYMVPGNRGEIYPNRSLNQQSGPSVVVNVTPAANTQTARMTGNQVGRQVFNQYSRAVRRL